MVNVNVALTQGAIDLTTLLDGVSDPLRAIQFVNNLLKAANYAINLQGAEGVFDFAKLNPTANTGETDGFLDILWRTEPGNTPQINRKIQEAAQGLSDLFAGANKVQQKIDRLGFADRLIDAAQLVPSLQQQQEAKNPTFLSALLGLGAGSIQCDSRKSRIIAMSSWLY